MTTEMRYVHVNTGNIADDLAMTLYEIDPTGWVHREMEVSDLGNTTRFSPEDMLLLRPLDVDAMVTHPAAQSIDSTEFERIWAQVQAMRPFHRRVPDITQGWWGALQGCNAVTWLPDKNPGPDLIRVPGFERLFMEGSDSDARRVCRQLFLERPIEWREY